jgi:dolichol kinase
VSTSDAIEDRRQIEHLVPLGLAFLLPFIDYRGILVLAAIGLIYALYLSPFWVKATMRPEESKRGFAPPKLYYVLAVLAVLLLNLDNIYVAAGAWAILAVGDALSSLVGRRLRRWEVPYNPRKTWPGAAAFWAGSTPAAWLLLLWTLPAGTEHSYGMLLACAAVASFYCALLETLPSPVDDNILIMWVGWIVLHILFFAQDWRPAFPGLEGWPLSLAGLLLLSAVGCAWFKGRHLAAIPALAVLSLLVFGWVGLTILLVPGVFWLVSGKHVGAVGGLDRLAWALAVPASILSLSLLVEHGLLAFGFYGGAGFSVFRIALASPAGVGSSWQRRGLAVAAAGLFLSLTAYRVAWEGDVLAILAWSIGAGMVFEGMLRWRRIVSRPIDEGPLLLHGALFAAFAAGVLAPLAGT